MLSTSTENQIHLGIVRVIDGWIIFPIIWFFGSWILDFLWWQEIEVTFKIAIFNFFIVNQYLLTDNTKRIVCKKINIFKWYVYRATHKTIILLTLFIWNWWMTYLVSIVRFYNKRVDMSIDVILTSYVFINKNILFFVGENDMYLLCSWPTDIWTWNIIIDINLLFVTSLLYFYELTFLFFFNNQMLRDKLIARG